MSDHPMFKFDISERYARGMAAVIFLTGWGYVLLYLALAIIHKNFEEIELMHVSLMFIPIGISIMIIQLEDIRRNKK